MKPSFVRLFSCLAVVTLAACGSDSNGSARLASLEEGMTLEQAVDAMGPGPLVAKGNDSIRVVGGYRRIRYFLNGANYEVVYARDLDGDVSEPLLQANETPAVFKDGKLMGWGWKYYVEEAMPKFQLPTPLRAVDTMSVYQKSEEKADSVKRDSVPKSKPELDLPDPTEVGKPPAVTAPKSNKS